MDKTKTIEKYILRYIFIHGKFEFKGDYKFELYKRLSPSIEKELNVSIVGIDDFNDVFDKLVSDEMIKVKFEDEKSFVKKGTIEACISFRVRDYVFENGYVELEEAFEYTDQKYYDVLDICMAQFKRMEKTENELKAQKKELLDKIHEQERQIKNFYNNILTILGILVAVFSIIGFNIGGIKFIIGSDEKLEPWVYAGSIGIINLCIVMSLYFLFALVNKVINKNENKNAIFSNKAMIFLFCIILIVIILCFVIA